MADVNSDPKRQGKPEEPAHDRDRPKLENVLGLLDSEIDRLLTEQTRHGWTNWAVLAGLAGVLWLIVGVLEKGDAELAGFLRLFLVFFLLIDTFRIFTSLLFWKPIRQFDTDRFQWASYLGNRAMMLTQTLRAGALILIVWLFGSGSGWSVIISATAFYGVLGMFWLSFLISDLIRQPLQITPGVFSVRTAAGGLILTLLGGWALVGYMPALLHSSQALVSSDYRMAGLLTVAVILIGQLAGSLGEPTLVSSLIQTRRGLALGQLDLETGIRQIDIALAGMRVADVLQAEIQSYLVLSDRIDTECSFIEYEVDALKSSLPTGKPLSEKESMLATSVLRSTVDHYTRITDLRRGVGEVTKTIFRRLKRFPRGSPRVQEDIEKLVNALTQEEQRLSSRVARVEGLIKSISGSPPSVIS